jgi:hypothetical protein
VFDIVMVVGKKDCRLMDEVGDVELRPLQRWRKKTAFPP